MNDHDLELLIKIVAREQRYNCIESVTGQRLPNGTTSRIMNAPAPDTAKVLKEWRKELSKTHRE